MIRRSPAVLTGVTPFDDVCRRLVELEVHVRRPRTDPGRCVQKRCRNFPACRLLLVDAEGLQVALVRRDRTVDHGRNRRVLLRPPDRTSRHPSPSRDRSSSCRRRSPSRAPVQPRRGWRRRRSRTRCRADLPLRPPTRRARARSPPAERAEFRRSAAAAGFPRDQASVLSFPLRHPQISPRTPAAHSTHERRARMPRLNTALA